MSCEKKAQKAEKNEGNLINKWKWGNSHKWWALFCRNLNWICQVISEKRKRMQYGWGRDGRLRSSLITSNYWPRHSNIGTKKPTSWAMSMTNGGEVVQSNGQIGRATDRVEWLVRQEAKWWGGGERDNL